MKRQNDKTAADAKKKSDKRGIDWLLLLSVPVLLYFVSLLVSQQVYLNQIGREQEAADKRLQTALEINTALKKERDELNDPSHIERVAREELGMTREGELPYRSVKK